MRKHVAVPVLVLAVAALLVTGLQVRADQARLRIVFPGATPAGAQKSMRVIQCTRVTFPSDPTKPQPAARMMGRRKINSFTIVKEVDAASPEFLVACNQKLPINATIVYTERDATTGQEKPYLTLHLINATITKIDAAPKSARGKEQEQFALTYQKITCTWTQGGKTFQDDWTQPT